MLPILLYDNRLNDGALDVTSTAAGFNVLNLKNLRAYTFWKATNNATQYIVVDCGSEKTADCLAILGHNLGSIGATVTLQSSADNFNPSVNDAFAGVAVTSDRIFFKEFAAPVARRYWRLKIDGASAAPQIAVLMFGNKLQFPYPPETPFPPYEESVETDTKRSKAGHLLGSVVRYFPRKMEARFTTLSRDFVFNTYKPFWEGHASLMKRR